MPILSAVYNFGRAPKLTVGELRRATIAVITVLPSEQRAVVLALGPAVTQTHPRSARVYDVATVRSLTGPQHVVAIFRMAQMGNQHAQLAVQQVFEDCPLLDCVLFSGIAGAVPNPLKAKEHVRLGDIVVGTDGVFPYRDGKEWNDRFEIRARVRAPMLGNRLIGAARRLQEQESTIGLRPWDPIVTNLTSTIPNSSRPNESDELVEPSNSRFSLIRKWKLFDKRFPHPYDELRTTLGSGPRVFYGVVASANVVQASQSTRDLVRDVCGARCFEMEGYGVQFSAEAMNLEALVVRGTSDYCNSRKNSEFEAQWQRYAANLAAAYVRSLIENLPSVAPRPMRDFEVFINRVSMDGLLGDFLSSAQQLIGDAAAQSSNRTVQPQETTTQSGLPSFQDPEKVWSEIVMKLDQMEELQLSFDLDRAFQLADAIDTDLVLYAQVLSIDRKRQAAFRLASVEIVRAEVVAENTGASPDYSRARRIVDRAS